MKQLHLTGAAAILGMVLGSSAVLAQAPASNGAANAPTADAQKNDPADLALTQRIRKGIMRDKTLSTSAHNVQIVSIDGTVTLRGTVKDKREARRVVRVASKAAGSDRVVNNLEVGDHNS